MSRLTKEITAYGKTYIQCDIKSCPAWECTDCHHFKEIIAKLKHYEDLEEQDRLIEQKHGQWIPFELDTRGYVEIMDYECSSCHGISDDATMYCPNCGAKMAELKGNDTKYDLQKKNL